MRLSVCLLLLSLAGILAGGWLIGRWAFGVCLIADSLLLGLWVLFRDDGRPEQPPQVYGVPTLADVLEKARRAG